MPTYPFGDADPSRSRPDVIAHEGMSPERKLSVADRTGEDPVRRSAETGSAAPNTKSANQMRIEWDGLLGRFSFAWADCLFDNRSHDANLLSSEVDISPL